MSWSTSPSSALWPGGPPLDRVFASASHIRILRALDLLWSAQAVPTRRLAAWASVSPPRAGEVLKQLCDLGLVHSWWGRNHSLHRPRRTHELWDLLSPLFRWEEQADERLRHTVGSALDPVGDLISVAVLVGAELIVVREATTDPRLEDQISIAENLARDRFGIPLRAVVSTPSAAAMAHRKRSERWVAAYREGVPVMGSWDRVKPRRRGGGPGSDRGPGGPSTRTGAG